MCRLTQIKHWKESWFGLYYVLFKKTVVGQRRLNELKITVYTCIILAFCLLPKDDGKFGTLISISSVTVHNLRLFIRSIQWLHVLITWRVHFVLLSTFGQSMHNLTVPTQQNNIHVHVWVYLMIQILSTVLDQNTCNFIPVWTTESRLVPCLFYGLVNQTGSENLEQAFRKPDLWKSSFCFCLFLVLEPTDKR